jgi:hypothetical protein
MFFCFLQFRSTDPLKLRLVVVDEGEQLCDRKDREWFTDNKDVVWEMATEKSSEEFGVKSLYSPDTVWEARRVGD